MALVIRLKRTGRKNQKLWRIVVLDRRRPRDGRSLEEIGTYNPLIDPPAVTVRKDRYDEWIRKGARPSDTVRSLIQKKEEKPKGAN